jgi:hypothetical protein
MSGIEKLLAEDGASFEAQDDSEAAFEYCLERGWSDGLPVVLPTTERVERMLAYCDRPYEEPIAMLAPRYGAATPLRIAANAVMAGCRPEYFPLVLLALEAMAEEPFNLYGIQATTHPCAPLIIVNGPVARELGMNAGHSALGTGNRANATIGRAVRLALVNIGGAIPGLGDMCTYGGPAKFSYCAAENEAANPWQPLHVERGFPATASTVTVVAAEPPHNVNDHESHLPESILKTIAGTIATTGSNNTYHASEPVILLSPEHAATIAGGGLSKQAVKEYLFEHGRIALGRFSDENVARRFRVKFPEKYAHAGPDALVPIVQKADDFIVVVIGGAGKHSAFMPTFGNTHAVTRALTHADGSLVSSIASMRREHVL